MAKTVYMVASDEARKIFEEPDKRWNRSCGGCVTVDSVLDDAREINTCGHTLYRCEPIDLADEEPAPEPRTVKAYVAFDPNESWQALSAYNSEELARSRNPSIPIFEIEMREVKPAPREIGWIVKGGSGRGVAFGTHGFTGKTPCFFSESTAKELAASSYYSEGEGVAIEVYRDNLEPVDGGSDA